MRDVYRVQFTFNEQVLVYGQRAEFTTYLHEAKVYADLASAAAARNALHSHRIFHDVNGQFCGCAAALGVVRFSPDDPTQTVRVRSQWRRISEREIREREAAELEERWSNRLAEWRKNRKSWLRS